VCFGWKRKPQSSRAPDAAFAKAIAWQFLREGARVLICDIVAERIELSKHELQPLGEVHALAGDVTSAAFRAELIAGARRHFGELHVLVNNARIAVAESFPEHSESPWNRTLAAAANFHARDMLLACG